MTSVELLGRSFSYFRFKGLLIKSAIERGWD